MDKLFITLDGGRKLKVGSPQTFKAQEFNLRTVDVNQFQAKICVGIILNDQEYILHSVFTKDLQASDNGYSYLDCKLVLSENSLTLTVRNRGRVVSRESFSLTPKEILIKRVLIGVGVVLLLAAIVVSLFLVDFSSQGQSTSSYDNSTLPSDQISQSGNNTSTDNSISHESTQTVTLEEPKSVEHGDSVSETTGSIGEMGIAQGGETSLGTESDQTTGSESGNKIVPETAVIIEEVVHEKVVIDLPYEQRVVYFFPNNTRIPPESEETLRKILVYLLENPDLNVKLMGHCAIAGTEAGRREISEQRAKNVEEWFRRNGWKPTTTPEVLGQASLSPLTRDPDEQEINRRVEIEFLQ